MDEPINPMTGVWRITEMDGFDDEYLNLCGKPLVRITEDGTGSLNFGVVDVVLVLGYGPESVDFEFEGDSEGDEVYGTGWFQLEEDGTPRAIWSLRGWRCV